MMWCAPNWRRSCCHCFFPETRQQAWSGWHEQLSFAYQKGKGVPIFFQEGTSPVGGKVVTRTTSRSKNLAIQKSTIKTNNTNDHGGRKTHDNNDLINYKQQPIPYTTLEPPTRDGYKATRSKRTQNRDYANCLGAFENVMQPFPVRVPHPPYFPHLRGRQMEYNGQIAISLLPP